MQESFLHFIWQFQYFNKQELRTCDAENLNILHPGSLNSDAGPDFNNSRLLVGEILWHGHVEIHRKSSEWDLHRHQADPSYNKVILHVVWENDKPVFRKDGTAIPTLEMKNRIDKTLIEKYNALCNNLNPVPCANQISTVEEIIRISMLEKALLERLENKSRFARKLYVLNNNDWESTAYQLLAKNFGFKINSDAFLQLSQIVPLKILRKEADSLLKLEAILFGQAGFLAYRIDDPYYKELQKAYLFLSHKYKLGSAKIQKHAWKFLRLRPANFPSLRIAQFAALIYETPSIFSILKEEITYKKLYASLKVKPSAYWVNHYDFGKPTSKAVHAMGKDSIENLILNTVVPILVAIAHVQDQQHYIERAIDFLQQLPPEKNRITRLWDSLGIHVSNGFDSQALIETYNNYCSKKRCLSCTIGTSLVKDQNH